MILYLGTSSLAKLYIEEKYSDIVRDWAKAEIVATCRVAYTEMISALELQVKRNDLSKSDYDHIMEKFSQDWLNFAIVDFDEREAGSLAAVHDVLIADGDGNRRPDILTMSDNKQPAVVPHRE